MDKPLVVAGSGRSGTTWVVDSISKANNLRTIFEPLHPTVVKGASNYAYQFIDKDSLDEKLRKFFDKIFAGEINNIWVNYRVRKDRLKPKITNICSMMEAKILYSRYKKLNYRKYQPYIYSRPITKFIRANLILSWIKINYDARIIFLVRHPGAVVESKLRMVGNDWEPQIILEKYCRDSLLKRAFLHKHEKLLDTANSPIEKQTIIWCIENIIPLNESRRNNYCVVYYENLVNYPEYEWTRIMKYLKLKSIPDGNYLKIPSQQTSRSKKKNNF